MNNKLTVIQRLNYSLKPKSYIEFFRDKLRYAILHILILATMIGSFQGILLVTEISNLQSGIENNFSKEEFQFTLKDGILDFKASPYKVEQGQTLVLLDTSKEVKDLDTVRNVTVHKDLSTIIFKDGIVIKAGATEVEYLFKDIIIGTTEINNDSIIESMKILSVVKFILIPVMIISQFVQILIYSLIISTIGFINVKLSRQRVPYSIIIKISMYAITLPTILSMFINILDFQILIGGLMLVFGLNYALNKPNIKKTNPNENLENEKEDK